jgi:hypothetical protein
MFSFIALPVLLSLAASTVAMPTNYGSAHLAARSPYVACLVIVLLLLYSLEHPVFTGLSTRQPSSSRVKHSASFLFLTLSISSTETLCSSHSRAPPACASKAKREESLSKRTAQADLPAVAESWQQLCQASGGDIVTNDPCVQLAGIRGISALLANGAVCDQQHVADGMCAHPS